MDVEKFYTYLIHLNTKHNVIWNGHNWTLTCIPSIYFQFWSNCELSKITQIDPLERSSEGICSPSLFPRHNCRLPGAVRHNCRLPVAARHNSHTSSCLTPSAHSFCPNRQARSAPSVKFKSVRQNQKNKTVFRKKWRRLWHKQRHKKKLSKNVRNRTV